MLSYSHEVMHMQNNRMKECPACGEKLHIGRLICPGCHAEFPTDTPLSAYDYLTADESAFLTAFLTCRGNLKEVQTSLGISYPSAKKKLDGVLESLGLKEKKTFINIKENPDMLHFSAAHTDSTRASDIVKSKLLACGGSAVIPMASGKTCRIGAQPDGKTFVSDNLNFSLDYTIFDLIADFLLRRGGNARKGNGRNYRYGEGDCADDTVVGMLAKEYFERQLGESTLDPVFVLAAVLDWAGIAHNGRGYLELTADYLVKVRG